jgi:hypothetical protein
MPQTTNLNTPPYFEDFDATDNFHKVLFRPGFPLQARELTVLQSVLQDQIEKFGSSIYKDGAMVIPGQISFDLYYTSVLIEDEYFGISADTIRQYVVGQTIVGQSSGIRARVVNAISSEESEKGKTTLYVKYTSAGSSNTSGTFQDDEILLAEDSFSIGETVIQADTDFAKCVTENATHTGSAAKITPGIYFIKGFFTSVAEQEIILDQFGVTPSYKVGLQVLETIVTPEDDETLTDPSQGYSNYSAPGAHRLKLEAKLVKKSLSDESVTDFIELLKLEEGQLREIVQTSRAQIARTLEDTLARRTYDESGDYEVRPYKFTKDECLDNGVNNGIFAINEKTDQDNTPSSDLFEVNVSPGKSYVLGYEIENISTTYVDIAKPRTTDKETNKLISTDARGFEFRTAKSNEPIYQNLQPAYQSQQIAALKDGANVIGYGLFVGFETESTYDVVRVAAIKFLSKTNTVVDVDTIVINGNINFETNTVSGGHTFTINGSGGGTQPYLFKAYNNNVIKALEGASAFDLLTVATGTINASGNGGSVNVPFASSTVGDYTLRIDNDGVGTARPLTGATPNLSGGSFSFTIATDANTANDNFVLYGPKNISNPVLKLSSLKKMRVIKLKDIATKYDINDTTLSLGLTRVSKIHAIFNYSDPNANDFDTVYPNVTYGSGTPAFKAGEIVIGKSSGAKGRVIKQESSTTKLYFVYETSSNFIPNEELYGYESASTASVVTVNTNGLPNLKSRYLLDDGQRAHSFEFSTITKSNVGSAIPSGTSLWVVVDHFEDDNASGLFYTANSYYDAKIEEIPSFDWGPDKYYLNDCVDYRINQSDVFSTGNGEYNTPHEIDATQILANTKLSNYGNFNYIYNDEKLPAGFVEANEVEYYLGRIDHLYVNKTGEFVTKQGTASLNPKEPGDSIKNAMKLASISMPPYVRNLDDILITRFPNKRYTMKDIGRLEQRLSNVEYYTQLSLLESDTANLFISDGSGLNRLKNGFLVDNFTSHAVGDSAHPNYRCAMDMALGELRPQHFTTNVALKYEEVPSNYIKGDAIMLDYTHKVMVDQPFASGVENVNPFAVVSWVGFMVITPAIDDWVDEVRLPETLTSVEGDYAATVFAMEVDPNTGFAPTEWNAWETQWTSTSSGSSSSTRTENSGGGPPIRQVTTSNSWSTTRTGQTRTGIRPEVTPRVDREVLGDRVVDIKYAHWKRSRNIYINAQRLKPNIQVYSFLEGRDVNAYSTPKVIQVNVTSTVPFTVGEDVFVSGNVNRKFRAKVVSPRNYYDGDLLVDPYSGGTMPSNYTANTTVLNLDLDSMNELGTSEYGGHALVGDTLVGATSGATATVSAKKMIADESGGLHMSLFIPDPAEEGNPRWKVGESVLRLTDSATNSLIPGEVDSSVNGTYSASGTTFSKQQDVLLVRNAEVINHDVSESRVLTSSSSSSSTTFGGWYDPLAQSFLVEDAGGAFVSKVDIYFRTKDKTLPVTMQIREMVNGYPGPTVLATMNKTPSQVNLSEDATAVTSFEFDTPVYLAEQREYCFAILTSSVEYKVWLSEMGQDDINGNRISEQPYAGVLFKSQNASTWTANQLQDLKFTLYRAEFDISQKPVIKYKHNNDGLNQFDRLRNDPIELTVNGNYMKVNHYNHGMHDPSSFVEIKGVSTEEYAELAADWNGTPGGAVSFKGNRDFFAYSSNINGAVPSGTNPGYFKIGDAIYSYDPTTVGAATNGVYSITTISRVEGSIPSTGFKAADKWIPENYVKDGVPLTYINKTHSDLKWITMDSYQIAIPVTRTSTGPINFTFGGTNVYASKNVMYTSVLPLVNSIELPGTEVIATYRATNGTSLENSVFSNPSSSSSPTQPSYVKDSAFRTVLLNENNEFNVPKLMASLTNETNQMQGTSSANLYLELSSTKSNLSPIIDTQRVSLVTSANRVADVDGAYEKEYYFNDSGAYTDIGSESVEDFNPANYLTKLVTMENACTGLRVEFAAFNPSSSCNIDVYVKALTGEESDPKEIDWIELSDPNYATTQDEQFFRDFKYEYDITAGGTKPNATFTQFQVKVRMRSTNQAVVPIIKDLRCIALA